MLLVLLVQLWCSCGRRAFALTLVEHQNDLLLPRDLFLLSCRFPTQLTQLLPQVVVADETHFTALATIQGVPKFQVMQVAASDFAIPEHMCSERDSTSNCWCLDFPTVQQMPVGVLFKMMGKVGQGIPTGPSEISMFRKGSSPQSEGGLPPPQGHHAQTASRLQAYTWGRARLHCTTQAMSFILF